MSNIKFFILSIFNLINIIFIFLFKKLLLLKKDKKEKFAIIRLEQTLGDAVLGSVITKNFISQSDEKFDIFVLKQNAWLYKNIPNSDIISLNEVHSRKLVTELLFFLKLILFNKFIFSKNYKAVLCPRFWDDRIGALLAFALNSDKKYGFRNDVTAARKNTHFFLQSVFNEQLSIFNDNKHTVEIESLIYSKALKINPIVKKILDSSETIFSKKFDSHFEPYVLGVSLSSGNSDLKKASIESFFNAISMIIRRFKVHTIKFYNPDHSRKEESILVNLLKNYSLNYEYLLGVHSPEFLVSSLSSNALFIGCDSGLTHLSAQCGSQTFVLFTSSNYEIFSPIGNVQVIHNSALCNPVYSNDISDRCQVCILDSQVCSNISEFDFLAHSKN